MKTAYQIQAVAKHPQLLEAVWTEFHGEWMSGRNQVVRRRRTVRGMLPLEDKLGRSSLASNSRAQSGHSFWQVWFWSWKNLGPLSVGSARTRDQSDLRKRHIHFGRRNTTAEKGGNKDVAALPIERRGLSPVRLRQPFFLHKDSSQKSRHCKTNWAS